MLKPVQDYEKQTPRKARILICAPCVTESVSFRQSSSEVAFFEAPFWDKPAVRAKPTEAGFGCFECSSKFPEFDLGAAAGLELQFRMSRLKVGSLFCSESII